MILSTTIELLQLVVGLFGLTWSLIEAHAQMVVRRDIGHDQRQSVVFIADHLVHAELFRLMAHSTVILSAALGLSLPPAPTTMGSWYTTVIMFEKATILTLACVAASATWRARQVRLKLWSRPIHRGRAT